MRFLSRKVLSRRSSLLLSLIASTALMLPSASGCNKREDDLRNCDIPALFQSSCDGSGCHGAASPIAGLDLVSAGVSERLFHVPSSSACDNRKLIVPGHPEESVLYLKVAEKDPFCGARMPISRELSSSELACLADYIKKAGTNTDGQECETCGSILCVDFDRDPDHCGGCDQPCEEGMLCGAGQCLTPCNESESLCGSSCVSLEQNNDNCGSCGHRCGAGTTCTQGVCACDESAMDAVSNGGGTSGGLPSFQQDVLPLFENSCAGALCHTGEERAAPLGLDSETAYAHLFEISAEQCSGKQLVVPNSPDQSYLVDKLTGGSNLCAGERMPLSSDPLPDAAISVVTRWICAGAPDN